MIKNIENQKINGALSFLFASLFLFSGCGSSAQIVEVLLFLTLLVLFTLNFRTLKPCVNEGRYLSYAMLAMFVVYVICFLYSEGWTSKLAPLNPYANYAICALILYWILVLPVYLSRKVIFYTIACAGIINGIFTFYQSFALDISRVYGLIGIFKFSQTNGVICLFSCILFFATKNPKEKLMYALSAFGSLSVVILSVTRGSYVGLILGFLALVGFGIIVRKRKARFLFSIFVLALIGLFGAKMLLVSRVDPFNINAFKADMEKYEKGIVNSSNGLRLEMWKEAIAVFRLSPIFGMHSTLVDQNLEKIIELSQTKRTFNELLPKEERNPDPSLYPSRPQVVKAIAQNRHNQFFNTLAFSGIVGVMSLFGLIFVLFYVFLKGYKTQAKCERNITLMAMSALFFWGGCCIGDVVFSSNFMIPFMMLTFIVLFKLKEQERINAA